MWTDRSRLDGARVADSGGHELFVSPGLQYMYSTIIIEASVQVPVPTPDRRQTAAMRDLEARLQQAIRRVSTSDGTQTRRTQEASSSGD